jgi:hypothetical protein
MKVQESTRFCQATVAAFLLFLGAGVQAPAESDHAVGPGCDLARPAVAYHAGSIFGAPAYTPHLPNLPIPCAVVSDVTMETATVGITQNGTVVFAPQSKGNGILTFPTGGGPPAVVISHNDGATWNLKTPTLQPETGSGIPWMHVDAQTGRIWFAPVGTIPSTCPKPSTLIDPTPTLAQVTWSDDEGQSWHSPPGDPAACRLLQGGMSIVEGPAPRGQPQPVGYPHVVYHCGNESDFITPHSVRCWKSLNGGETWSFVQGPNSPPSNCTATGGNAARGRAIGLDGTLYMSIQCQLTANGAAIAGPGPLYVASSHDEGNTWEYQFVTNTTYELTEGMLVSSIGIDQADNLYIVWVDDQNRPLLIVGKGSKWSNTLNVAQPGVTYVNRVAVAVDNPGHIAIAYLGSPGGMNGAFNGYIAESNDALSEDPAFVGASVNDPLHPLMSSAYADAGTVDEGRIWVLTTAFGPDGTPWAGFQCANMTDGTTTGTTTSIICPNGAAPPPAPLALGVVGRLATDYGQHADNGNFGNH